MIEYMCMYISVVLLCTKTERHALSHPSPGQDLEDFLKLVQLWVGKRSASNAQAAAFECLSLTHQCRLHHWIWGRPSKTPRPMFQTNLASMYKKWYKVVSQYQLGCQLSSKKCVSLLFWSILMVIYSKLSECLCKIGDPTSLLPYCHLDLRRPCRFLLDLRCQGAPPGAQSCHQRYDLGTRDKGMWG